MTQPTNQSQSAIDDILRTAGTQTRDISDPLFVDDEILTFSQREKLVSQIKAVGNSPGNKTVTDSEAEKKVDEYFSGKLAHTPPTLSRTDALFSHTYTHRKSIAKAITGGALAFAVAAGMLAGGNIVWKQYQKKVQDTEVIEVKQLIGSESSKLVRMRNEVDQMTTVIDSVKLPTDEAQSVQAQRKLILDELLQGENALAPFKGVAITYSAIATARTAADTSRSHAVGAAAHLAKAQEIVSAQSKLHTLETALESNYKAIVDMDLPVQVKAKAGSIYDQGVAAYTARNATSLANVNKSLSQMRTGVANMRSDYTAILLNAQQIQRIAKVDELKSQAAQAIGSAELYLSTAEFEKLHSLQESTRDLETRVELQYTVRIVDKQGVKSGIDRYYTDKSGKRSAGYYVIVEAVDSNGRVLSVPITNREDNQTQTVTMWGESVPLATYEKVKADKLDNGVIDNNIFAKKERGYLDMKIEFPVQRTGQITRW